MLDGARNSNRDIKIRRHNLAGLAYLPVVRRIAGVDGSARSTDRGAELASAGAAAVAAGGPTPSPEQVQAMEAVARLQVFTEGSTQAFLVGSLLMLAASAVIWIFLGVKHEELATDGPEPVHMG